MLEKVNKAKRLGVMAYLMGFDRKPVLDKKVTDMVNGEIAGSLTSLNIFKAWLEGWDEMSLMSPVQLGGVSK